MSANPTPNLLAARKLLLAMLGAAVPTEAKADALSALAFSAAWQGEADEDTVGGHLARLAADTLAAADAALGT